MYSVELELCDDERETVVVGDGDACSIEDDDDVIDVLLSFCDDDDEFLCSEGSEKKKISFRNRLASKSSQTPTNQILIYFRK